MENQPTLASTTSGARGLRLKALYRQLETALDDIERTKHTSDVFSEILAMLVSQFRDQLGFEKGRCYQRDGEDFVLYDVYPDRSQAPIGYRVPRDYLPHQRILTDGLVIMRPDDPAFDPAIEGVIGVNSTFAAIAVGPGNTHILSFSVRGEIREEQILYSLTAIRHVINLKLAQQKLAGMLEESKVIQESLLPAAPPVFAGYDVFGRSIPTEVVGGDLFDYLRLSDKLLGIAIGDVSGHGLPAALLARDVITGLRVGMDEDLKVARVIERLNRVIHRAMLSSRFVSLFYGEFGHDGSLTFCNAGHNPPLLYRGDSFQELDRGGLVLGPDPEADYEAGHIHLESGDTLCMYTDGIIERTDPRGRFFGLERLHRWLRSLRGNQAKETVQAILDAVEAHAEGSPQTDDMTVVVVRRL